MKKNVLNILLIEDNSADAALILDMLGSCGARCILKQADRLSSGLRLLETEPCDVVILDLGLPDSSGIDTLGKFREMEPEMPVIVLTGLADEDLAEKAISMGAQDYLAKGKIDYDILYRSLRYSLDRKVAQMQLEAANKELEAFSYSVSHDLRAPLMLIGGLSNRVLKKYHDSLDDSGREMLETIRGEIRKMERLIEALLSLSRAGRHDITITEVDMEKMATDVAVELKTAYPDRSITITVLPLPAAHCDAVLIHQVFTNLLSNAIKFTRKNADAAIEVGCLSRGDENIYHVRDNGAGFDMAQADKLFGVFKRLHNQTEYEGTGVGLSLVKRIIERHGGRVWAEGKVNNGATFYFSLPSRA